MTENHGIKLGLIPEDKYSDYRYDVIFKAYKWDPQVEDRSTVSKHAVLMSNETANQLETWSEQLSEETILMEEELSRNILPAKELGLPRKIYKALNLLNNYSRNQNVRLMRFDFHPTTNGWAISEVNSDVPGGLAEASILPQIAEKYFEGYIPGNNTAERILEAFKDKLHKDSVIAFVHATSYSDDRQVMQFLSDYFNTNGVNTIFAAPDHIKWIDKKAVSIIEGQYGNIDGIIRFFPLEWLTSLPRKSNWKGYYDCLTPSCNHPISIFAQSKRLPLIWDKLEKLGVKIPVWRKLLPETKDPVSIGINSEWIYKPALGRVGEGISIKNAIPEKERLQIEKSARKYHKDWIAQRMFNSQPLSASPESNNQSYHLCVGVFTVNGKRAGFYARISPYPLIDSKAEDIPVLISQ